MLCVQRTNTPFISGKYNSFIIKIIRFQGFKVLGPELQCLLKVKEDLSKVFEPHRRHCVVVLEQDTFILA